MSRPLLSVIVANFNNAAYLDECLESVTGQTFRDFEVVVVDDASTDASPERIRSWQERYPGVVRALFNPANLGVARSRHRAIEESRGAFLATLDGDDYYHDPRKLEREMSVAAGQDGGEAAIAFSDTLLVRDDRTPIVLNSQRVPLREGFILENILARSCLIPRDFVMPRSAYEEVGGYDFRFPIYEDWDLKIRLAERRPFRFSGVVGTAYRRHGRGLSSAPAEEHVYWLRRVFAKNLHRADPARHGDIQAAFDRFCERLVRNRAGPPPAASGPGPAQR